MLDREVEFRDTNDVSVTPAVPSFLWRVTTLLGLWLLIFGGIMAITPLYMEGGYDITQEKLKATYCSPLLGCLGLASFLSPASVSVI